jgi:hypothetical protein
MKQDIRAYHEAQTPEDRKICNLLYKLISNNLPDAENKLWHSHPVWFLDDNPIVGYSKQKKGIRLMFWSGADFDEDQLQPGTGKFKDASIFYRDAVDILKDDLIRWISKSKDIQWDYINIVKRKGRLERLK